MFTKIFFYFLMSIVYVILNIESFFFLRPRSAHVIFRFYNKTNTCIPTASQIFSHGMSEFTIIHLTANIYKKFTKNDVEFWVNNLDSRSIRIEFYEIFRYINCYIILTKDNGPERSRYKIHCYLGSLTRTRNYSINYSMLAELIFTILVRKLNFDQQMFLFKKSGNYVAVNLGSSSRLDLLPKLPDF